MLWAGWDAVIRWWDGVELWLTGLVLPLQVAILMLVLLPVCWGAARVIDRVFGEVFERFGHRYPADATSSEVQTSSEAQTSLEAQPAEEPR